MCSANRSKHATALIPIGTMFLVVGILFPMMLHPATQTGKNLAEGIRGLLFGLSIGINLFSVILARRQGGCGN
jgi:hypothetical protein